jgi:hypothetical protein
VQMDWFNSAGVLYGHWKTQFPVPAIQDGVDEVAPAAMATSKGYRLAGLLHGEIVRTWSRASNSERNNYKGVTTATGQAFS